MVSRMSEAGLTASDPEAPPGPPNALEFADELVSELGAAVAAVLEQSGVEHNDINAGSGGGVYVVGWNRWQWTTLPDEAAPSVGRARQALSRLREFAACAARAAPDRRTDLTRLEGAFERLIEQPGGSLPNGAPWAAIKQIREQLDEHLTEYKAVLRRLPSASGSDERLLVVDTSALLDRPDLQDWKIDGQAWTIVFVPQVLAELDERKRDPHTRDAAQKIIRQLEEFDRRGDTTMGVPLAGKLTAREVVVSPDMAQTLPWLRSDTPDDVIIAGALELRWCDLRCRVSVAASDRNVRNKARWAGLGAVRATDL